VFIPRGAQLAALNVTVPFLQHTFSYGNASRMQSLPIAAEVNPERKALYQLCWHLGASQGDIANLKGGEKGTGIEPTRTRHFEPPH
jgi:hypothetical protein